MAGSKKLGGLAMQENSKEGIVNSIIIQFILVVYLRGSLN